MNRMVFAAALGALASCLAACDYTPTSDDIQNQHQETLNKQAVEAVGVPSITNFQEKRLLKQVYELRDTALRTYTYESDMNGHLHWRCDSIGYGLPYSTQFTNPEHVTADHPITNGTYYVNVLPQADPNGLYSPANAEGSWVLCTDPGGSGKQMPIYFEDRVIVSPFKLKSVD